jgi:colicin import membrane protein
MTIARWAFTVFLLTPLVAALVARTAWAQDQDDSVAAAARRAQEQRKDQPKAAKVYDNDNIPTNGPISVVGPEQPATNSTAATTADSANAQTVEVKAAPTAAEVAGMNADLAIAKQRLADLKADLDVAQRKFALDQATYYGKPNYVADKAGAAALASEKSDVDAKADAVAVAEKALAAAQAKLDAANQASAASQQKSAESNSTAVVPTQDNSAQAKSTPSAPPSTPDSDTTTVPAK